MSDRLVLLAEGQVMGQLHRARDRVELEYDPAWQRAPTAYPLSLSMPLASRLHRSAVVKPFLWNLLPDSEAILEGWARRFHVSARNPFALLSHVGEDCAGAVQLVRPERQDQQVRK